MKLTHPKLYIVTHRDLLPGYQGVQSIHAALQFAVLYPETFRHWFETSNYLAWLSVPDEAALIALGRRAQAMKLRVAVFTEPDCDYRVTAIAVEPGKKSAKLLKSLPLSLSTLVHRI